MTIDFNNGKIYKVVDNSSDMVYIGSTCNTLEMRLKQHESQYKGFKLGKTRNVTVFKILDNNNYKIELIKLFPCDNKKDLELEEGKIIKEYRNKKLNAVNRCIVGQTKSDYGKEYYQTKKDKINTKTKEYYQNNIDKIKESKKQYYETNIDKIKESKKQYYETNIDKIKESTKKYYENNIDKLNKNCKEYYQNNIDKIKESKKQKFNCPCGGKYSKQQKSRHEKTQIHCEFINTPKIIIPGDNNNITINIYCNDKNDLNKLNIV